MPYGPCTPDIAAESDSSSGRVPQPRGIVEEFGDGATTADSSSSRSRSR